MEETYENTAQIQSMHKERNEFSQNGATQPASLPVYRELESNTEIQAIRMEETYENTAQVQSLHNKGNKFLQNGATQPASPPVYKEVEGNTEIQGNFQVKVSPSKLRSKNIDPIPKSNTQREGTKVKLHFKDLGTPSGVTMLINMVLLFLSWCILTGWKSLDEVAPRWPQFYDEIHFFLSTTVLPFFISIIIFFLILCGVNNKMERGNWVLAMIINSALWSLTLMIASIVLAAKVADNKDDKPSTDRWCDKIKCDTLHASYAFGFLASIGLGVQTVFHLLEFIRSKSTIELECC